MVFAILSLPSIVEGIGTEKFGVLSIAWLFLGYFSILDLGIGRATTKFIIEFNNEGLVSEIKNLVWTSILFLFFFGLVAGGSLFCLTPYIVNHLLNIPDYLVESTIESFYIIAATIPFITGVAGAKGVLEARQKFTLLNFIKIPSSILNYAIPLSLIFFTKSLTLIVLFLAATRILVFFVHVFFCFEPADRRGKTKKFEWRHVRKLMTYGGWLTVSNLVGPIMVYFDRFIIGSILTLTLLTYYSTPYEVVTKLLVIAGSATTVLFPVFTNFYLTNLDKFYDVYNKSLKGMILIIFPVTLFIACFSSDILNIWLGSNFANESSLVLQILSLGVLSNSISAIPFTSIQAFNRPDITAKIHLTELPFYLASLWFFAHHFGIAGVALAWSLRSVIDAVAFMYFFVRITNKRIASGMVFILLFLVCCFAACFLLLHSNLLYKSLSYATMLVLFGLGFWFSVLLKDERVSLMSLTRKGVPL